MTIVENITHCCHNQKQQHRNLGWFACVYCGRVHSGIPLQPEPSGGREKACLGEAQCTREGQPSGQSGHVTEAESRVGCGAGSKGQGR